MKQRRTKYYVVWSGVTPGIYEDWASCKEQIDQQKNARYKSFPTREEAEEAYRLGAAEFYKRNPVKHAVLDDVPGQLIANSLCVDAACSGNPGDMEYRGVYTATGQEIFHMGPLKKGTNNIGEFLALVHGLALLKQRGSTMPIYSDSRNAILWVQKKKCKTLLERMPENEYIFELIARAEKWLENNTYDTTIIKWPTTEWGEIPADFGRK